MSEPIKRDPEWTNLTQAEKILGISRDELKSKIHKGVIPFRLAGTRYRINIKAARAFLLREDLHNMNAVKKELQLNPMSPKRVKIRQVVV